MGQLLMNPRLNEFVEIISDRNVAFDIVGLPITDDSPLAGKQLSQTHLRESGVMVIAVRHVNGKVELAPPGKLIIAPGDELFALGETDAVRKLSSTH